MTTTPSLPPIRGSGIEWAKRVKCPSCDVCAWIADDYGQTCTRCGFNYGFGEGERLKVCNHMWRTQRDDENPLFESDKVVVCVYCKAEEEIEEGGEKDK
jgi:hypothetical protein